MASNVFARDESADGQDNRFLGIALKKLYLDSETADVHFIFGDEKKVRIPAHKALMAANSATFKAMFYGDRPKEMPNVSIDAFKEFLQFFYFCDEIKLTMENITHVMDLGRDFTCLPCLSICEHFLLDSLSIENVCFTYGLAIRSDLDDLKAKCEEMIAENTETIFQSADFMVCEKTVLHNILKLELLNCAETMVFRSCVEWVKVASKRENVTKQLLHEYIGDLLYGIRFRSMTIEEFTTLLATYGDLFSSDEYQEILQLIVSKDGAMVSNRFHGQPRQKRHQHISIECICIRDECKMGAFYFQDIESIQFTVSKEMLLNEIVCSEITIANKEKQLPAELFIIEKCSDQNEHVQRVVCRQQITLKSQPAPIIIPLEKFVSIKRHTRYEIQFKQCPASSQFYSKPFQAEVPLPDTGIIVKFQTNMKIRDKISLINGLRFKLILDDA